MELLGLVQRTIQNLYPKSVDERLSVRNAKILKPNGLVKLDYRRCRTQDLHVSKANFPPQFPLHAPRPKPQFTQCTMNMSTSSGLTHVDCEGKAHMVDVSDKPATLRTATAEGTVFVGPKVAALIKENSLKKGDVLTVSQLAGVIGAKKTSELIPLCHNINLNNVKVTAALNQETHIVHITCQAKCHGKTGVEMEALTGVSVAALTVYDMCKAVTHDMVIKEIKLIEKTGGRRGVYLVDESEN